MIPAELAAKIRRLFHAERWPVGTIARQCGVHHQTVRRALLHDGVPLAALPTRRSKADPFVPFIVKTLEDYPGLHASRLYEMVKERGYDGGPDYFRAIVARHRPRKAAEAFLRLSTLPAEQAQVDWGHFGHIEVEGTRRPLVAFVMVLSWSRWMVLRFGVDMRMGSFLAHHEAAFEALGGVPRVLLYDNLKSAVTQRIGDAIVFNETLLQFASHWRYEPRPCAPFRGNEKGRVERGIRDVRTSFWSARTWTDLDDLNRQAERWCRDVRGARKNPDDRSRTVADAFAEERAKLRAPPGDRFPVADRVEVKVGKTPYVRFDGNDYIVPHDRVRRSLTVVATADTVRVLDGATEVSRLPRSWGKGRQVEDPALVAALAAEKARARESRGTNRVVTAAPSARRLLELRAERGGATSAAPSRGSGSSSTPSAPTSWRLPSSRPSPRMPPTWAPSDRSSTAGAERPIARLPSRSPSPTTRACGRWPSAPGRWAPTTSSRRRREATVDDLQKRLRALNLLGLAARVDELRDEPWLARVMQIEDEERQHRGLDRRLKNSRLGRFKPIADYDWSWPKTVDREAIEDLLTLRFVEEEANVVLVGPNGVGKTMVAKNLAHAAIRAGKSARFTLASTMLTELAQQDGTAALNRTLRRYTSPAVLVVDELGYVAYGNRHADVLFEVVNRRYEHGRHIVVTTNRSFTEWGALFPNATCVVALVDRLVHRSEIIDIDGDSYRLKEARERVRPTRA